MDKEFQFEGLPLPAFKLTKELKVLVSSQEAEKLFGPAALFKDLIDEGSLKKVEKLLKPENGSVRFEMNAVSASGGLLLADLYGKWQSDASWAVVVVPKEDNIERISQQLRRLQERLRETDYDLFQEKELSMQLLQRVRMLSAPSIRLDLDQMLIPLFGDLTAVKVKAVGDNVLKNIHDSHVETAIIDFTAVDQIEEEGLKLWNGLMQSLKVMGVECIVTGIKPAHAKRLHGLESTTVMRFASTLLEVLNEKSGSRL